MFCPHKYITRPVFLDVDALLVAGKVVEVIPWVPITIPSPEETRHWEPEFYHVNHLNHIYLKIFLM